jgi:hypothetical protein
MAIQPFRMGDFHSAEDKFAACNQLMNIIADANVNHAPIVGAPLRATKQLMILNSRP